MRDDLKWQDKLFVASMISVLSLASMGCSFFFIRAVLGTLRPFLS